MISVKELIYTYKESGFSLKKLNFKINKGELVSIIGPSGSGKSTILKCLSSLYSIQYGQILIKHRHINSYKRRDLAKIIGVVPQFVESYDPGFTVSEFVLMGRISYRNRFQLFESKYDKEILKKSLEATSIDYFRTRDISMLSGGEKQRMLIARALCQDPEVLLLDEPTSHLDIGHQIEIMDLLKKLNNKGLTVLTILHDINLASLYADRIILLNKGAIHSIGTPKEIINESVINDIYKTKIVVEQNKYNSKPNVFLMPNIQQKKEEA